MAAPRNLWKTPDKGRGKLGKAGSGPVGRSEAQWGGGLFSPDFKRWKHTSSMEIKSVFPSGSQSRRVKRQCVLSARQQMLRWRRCLNQERRGKRNYRSFSPHRVPSIKCVRFALLLFVCIWMNGWMNELHSSQRETPPLRLGGIDPAPLMRGYTSFSLAGGATSSVNWKMGKESWCECRGAGSGTCSNWLFANGASPDATSWKHICRKRNTKSGLRGISICKAEFGDLFKRCQSVQPEEKSIQSHQVPPLPEKKKKKSH